MTSVWIDCWKYNYWGIAKRQTGKQGIPLVFNSLVFKTSKLVSSEKQVFRLIRLLSVPYEKCVKWNFYEHIQT